MAPLTAATSFGAIVSLMADFVSSRRSGESQTIDEYVDWLRRHEHQQLADAIANNAELSRSLDKLIKSQHSELVAKLNKLDNLVASIARHLGMEDLAFLIHPQSVLSDQAVRILRQLREASASRFFILRHLGGTEYQMMGGSGGMLRITEPLFIDDDLRALCDLGLLLFSQDSQGTRVFTITRAGDALAQQVAVNRPSS